MDNSARDAFVNGLRTDLQFFLIHGPDVGLMRERSEAIVRMVMGGDKDSLRVVRLQGDAVARDPEILADEAYAIPLFGGNHVIWIEQQLLGLLPALEPLLAKPPRDCPIVISAAELPKSDPLRSAFEKAHTAVSIECPEDETRALASLVDVEASAAGLAVSNEARSAILASVGEDRQITRSEISKLILYTQGRGRIELSDVIAIVSSTAAPELNVLIDYALDDDLLRLTSETIEFFGEGGNSDQLIGHLVGRAILLNMLCLEMDLRLPFSIRHAFAGQAERWTPDSIGSQLQMLAEARVWMRKEARLAETLVTNALWTLSIR